MKTQTFIYEGETEQKLLLKELKLGKAKKFNLWEKEVSKIVIKIPRKNTIYIIYDTDTIRDKKELKQFIKNIIYLIKTQKYKVFLLQQTANFEDEISYCCNISKNKLFKEFNSSGKTEFKTKFIKANNLLSKLEKINFQKNKLWSRDIKKELNQFDRYQKKDFFK